MTTKYINSKTILTSHKMKYFSKKSNENIIFRKQARDSYENNGCPGLIGCNNCFMHVIFKFRYGVCNKDIIKECSKKLLDNEGAELGHRCKSIW